MNIKKISALFLAMVLLFVSAMPVAFAEETATLTRGEAVEMLLTAVDDYNPTVQKSDIIKGYGDGLLHEDKPITRAEAFVMIKRAFGELHTPTGHNARVAFAPQEFTDIPTWADADLKAIFNAGLDNGTGEGIFSSNELISREDMDLFIKRVFSLYGTNLKDDFYATINKDTLNTMEIKPGWTKAGVLANLTEEATKNVSEIIKEITSSKWEKGTPEYKVAALYNSVLNKEERNKTGIAPIKDYLDMIDKVTTIEELTEVNNILFDELCVAPFLNFNVYLDMKDSTKHIVRFLTPSARLQKEFYLEEGPKKDTFIKYLKTMLVLSGETETDAQIIAENNYAMEKYLSEKTLDIADRINADLVYNLFTYEDIKQMFPGVDIDAVYETTGLEKTDKILIEDVECTKAFAAYYTIENIDCLKASAKIDLLLLFGKYLNQEFIDANNTFYQEYMGIEGTETDEEIATQVIENTMSDYIGKIYSEKHFSEKAKNDVEKMVTDIIGVYRKRLENNDWMSDATKVKAIEKLDTMGVKIGYPDTWEDYYADTEILAPEDGGTYFRNMLAIGQTNKALNTKEQNEDVDKSEWILAPYIVNAGYNFTANDITFPAAILQAPIYDPNASYEENLGGIGYIIAHEISHAFDNNGSKFDAEGNASDWWTEEDYAIFNKKCEAMVAYYDGAEVIPGIACNGTLTLGENVADNGSLSCITEIVSGLENPDFEGFFKTVAKCWANTAARASYEHFSQTDTHSPDKLRVNRTLSNIDEFYKTFGITEEDGMYVAPEDRVKIW